MVFDVDTEEFEVAADLITQVIGQVVILGGAGIHLGITAVGAGMTHGMILGISLIIAAGTGTILGIMVMRVGMIPGIIEAIGAGVIRIIVPSL